MTEKRVHRRAEDEAIAAIEKAQKAFNTLKRSYLSPKERKEAPDYKAVALSRILDRLGPKIVQEAMRHYYITHGLKVVEVKKSLSGIVP